MQGIHGVFRLIFWGRRDFGILRCSNFASDMYRLLWGVPFGLYLELNDHHDEIVQRSMCVHILIVEYNQNQISRLLWNNLKKIRWAIYIHVFNVVFSVLTVSQARFLALDWGYVGEMLLRSNQKLQLSPIILHEKSFGNWLENNS